MEADFFIQRIENLVGEGVPDVHLTSRVDGRQHWLELKHVTTIPKRPGTRVFGNGGLRPEQTAWIYCRAAVGASVWIFAQAGEWLFLIRGFWAREFNDASLKELQDRAAWSHEGRLTDAVWSGLLSAILGAPLYREK
ncbi:hypothetical protein [Immundisolibacter sp.]